MYKHITPLSFRTLLSSWPRNSPDYHLKELLVNQKKIDLNDTRDDMTGLVDQLDIFCCHPVHKGMRLELTHLLL